VNDNHQAGFRPSHFPALCRCVHHVYKPVEDPTFLERGDAVHKTIAAVLREWMVGRQFCPSIARKDTVAPVAEALSVVSDYLGQGWRIAAVELALPILDAEGSPITHGTIDLVLERDGHLLVIDWKTGDASDYSSQLDAYALAASDQWTLAQSVTSEIVYLDLEETTQASSSYVALSARVLGLYDRWRDKESQPHTISHYCDTCALRGDCPSWRKEADLALASINDIGADDDASLITARIDALKNDPERLEQFVSTWDRLKTLVEDDWRLKEALHTHMDTGYRGNYYSLVTVDPRESVTEEIDPEAWLLTSLETLGTAGAASAIRVDPAKAKAAWAQYSSDQFPVTTRNVTQTVAGYSYVRRKAQRGKGRAAQFRERTNLTSSQRVNPWDSLQCLFLTIAEWFLFHWNEPFESVNSLTGLTVPPQADTRCPRATLLLPSTRS
jgi:hypothetical protein